MEAKDKEIQKLKSNMVGAINKTNFRGPFTTFQSEREHQNTIILCFMCESLIEIKFYTLLYQMTMQ